MNQSLTNFIKQRADKVFYWWEEHESGWLDIRTPHDKIFEFSDWLDNQSDDDLRKIAQMDNAGTRYIIMLRREMNKGINAWLNSNKLFII